MRWDGESLTPINQVWASRADKQFVVGEVYSIEVVEQRSANSHRHYFAALHDIWLSLPEPMHEQFPTSEHLRKYALVRTGYRNTVQHVCASKAEALRLQAAIKSHVEFEAVTVDGVVVTVHSPKSQDHRSMDKETFQRSKQDVLDWCSDLIGVERKRAA
jgi:hypothetical protein